MAGPTISTDDEDIPTGHDQHPRRRARAIPSGRIPVRLEGKSTLMRILATITRPTTGRVIWNGVDTARDPDALRAVLGYLPQDFGIYPNLNAVEFLEYVAALKGLDGRSARNRILELLSVVNPARGRVGWRSMPLNCA